MDGGASYSAMLFAEAWELGLARLLLRPVRHRGPAADAGQQWRRAYCSRKDRGTGAGSPPPFRGQAVHQIQMGIPSRDRSGWSSTCAVVVLEEKCGRRTCSARDGTEPEGQVSQASYRRRPPTGLGSWFGLGTHDRRAPAPAHVTPLRYRLYLYCVHLEIMSIGVMTAPGRSPSEMESV